ncbi:unnamed protein product [Linum tenue]|uniref:NADH dehydrogenase [ubiquinone] 1 beta subcomplex subunit 7 n=3 Tax=Linum tenue TaxID=586396 RepID=A0AAV0NIC5_9ROSI|nr:unnamed protein product [Linum tenue]
MSFNWALVLLRIFLSFPLLSSAAPAARKGERRQQIKIPHFSSSSSFIRSSIGGQILVGKVAAMEAPGSSKPMIATQAEMVEARVPMAYRDQCAHLLIPLNKCRQAEFYLPWKCENERHSYEKCEYELVMERMLQMQKIREKEANLKQPNKGGVAIGLIPKTANA